MYMREELIYYTVLILFRCLETSLLGAYHFILQIFRSCPFKWSSFDTCLFLYISSGGEGKVYDPGGEKRQLLAWNTFAPLCTKERELREATISVWITRPCYFVEKDNLTEATRVGGVVF